MKLYFDSSALVKLVQPEPESESLRQFTASHRRDQLVTSALSRVEVVRTARTGGTDAIARACRLLADFDMMAMEIVLLDRAADLNPGMRLRSLDAIHLVTALMVGPDLRALVTYDTRMTEAAHMLGIPVEAPR